MEPVTILIFNHGRFGEELIKSVELITGKIEDIQAFSLLPGMSIEEFYALTNEAIQKIEGKKIVLCDLFGGTPCNVAMMLSMQYDFKLICGVNLPMLIDLVLGRNMKNNMDELLESAYDAAKGSIVIPNTIDEKRDIDDEY